MAPCLRICDEPFATSSVCDCDCERPWPRAASRPRPNAADDRVRSFSSKPCGEGDGCAFSLSARARSLEEDLCLASLVVALSLDGFVDEALLLLDHDDVALSMPSLLRG